MKSIYRFLAGGLLSLAVYLPATAQELFVYTEPASNMPAHSVGMRLNNWVMRETGGATNYHFLPEVMVGVNKNLMLHAEAFLSNRAEGGLDYEGLGFYGKYRFYTKDGDHRHFRMAAFGRWGMNNAPIHQDEIETNGHNSGYEMGLIGTQLLNRTAYSLTASYERATDNASGKEVIPPGASRNAINTSLSVGQLFLPRIYKGYDQVNLNGMVEVLSQWQPGNGKYYVDLAPSVQAIFWSQTRLDIGYRFALSQQMERTAPSGFLVRVEHLLFGVF